MTGTRIIAFARNPWEGPWMNRQQILSRLGRNYPVLYTTGLLSTWNLQSERWKAASWLGRQEARDGVFVDHPPALLLRVRNVEWLDRRVIGIAARRWRRLADRHGHGPLVAYVFHPRMWPFARAVGADIVVYHAYDLFSLQVGWTPAVAGLERELVQRADIVLGSSQVICDHLATLGGTAPELLPNAVDFAAYAREPVGEGPEDLRRIPAPRIGYLGKISRKVDLPLIGDLARAHPEWNFVFVGSHDNLDEESAASMGAVENLPNVHFLGFKDHSELPDYASRMDVNLISHRTDDALWTKGTFPLKLFEYLASGAPVVSADIPSVRDYREVIRIARSPEEWALALADLIVRRTGDAGRAARREVAAMNTWDHRVERIKALLKGLHR